MVEEGDVKQGQKNIADATFGFQAKSTQRLYSNAEIAFSED